MVFMKYGWIKLGITGGNVDGQKFTLPERAHNDMSPVVYRSDPFSLSEVNGPDGN